MHKYHRVLIILFANKENTGFTMKLSSSPSSSWANISSDISRSKLAKGVAVGAIALKFNYFGSGALPGWTLDLWLLKIFLGVLFPISSPWRKALSLRDPIPIPLLSLRVKGNLYLTWPSLKEVSILLFSIILSSSSLPESAQDPTFFLLK